MLEHKKMDENDDEIEVAAQLLLNFTRFKKKKVTFKDPIVENRARAEPTSRRGSWRAPRVSLILPSKPLRSCLKRC
ncbi:MAG: hypothetical protein AB7I18_01590 [Candidatus Berkiella sp.]